MSDLHDIGNLRPASRTTGRQALWIACAVAVGGTWVLYKGISQYEAAQMSTAAVAASMPLK